MTLRQQKNRKERKNLRIWFENIKKHTSILLKQKKRSVNNRIVSLYKLVFLFNRKTIRFDPKKHEKQREHKGTNETLSNIIKHISIKQFRQSY